MNNPLKNKLQSIKVQKDLEPLGLDKLVDNTVTDFNIYINVGGHMILYAPKPYHWTGPEITRLALDGHKELYYESEHSNLVDAYVGMNDWPEINSNTPPTERIEHIMDLGEQYTKLLRDHPFSETSLAKGKQIADHLLECIREQPSCIQALQQLKDHTQYTFYHSARVAAYATAVAIKLSLKDDAELHNITFGCLLHDLGKAKIPEKILLKPKFLNNLEWDVVRRHPQDGLDMIGNADLGIVPREIILHHHERPDGGGYPHALVEREILPEVRIAAFCDIFDALTSPLPYQKPKSRFEALEFMKEHLLGYLDLDSYRAMVALLAKPRT